MLDPTSAAAYERIYAVDMVYGEQCWKLCGDGHCCHFSRYRPPMLPPVQEFTDYYGAEFCLS